MLRLLEAFPLFAKLKPELQHLNAQATNIARQLGGWATSLQNSDIKGQRYLTDKSRRHLQGNKEREEFLEELRKMHEQRIAGEKNCGVTGKESCGVTGEKNC